MRGIITMLWFEKGCLKAGWKATRDYRLPMSSNATFSCSIHLAANRDINKRCLSSRIFKTGKKSLS